MMTASWVLEKQDRDKLRLCQFLTSQVADFMTIRHLLAEMGWTRYQFGQALAGLEQDLKSYGRATTCFCVRCVTSRGPS